GRRRPVLSMALARAVTSEGRSTEWMQSNRATASSALLDWSWPTRWSSIAPCASRRAGHLACASCTRFSPKTRWPAAISGAMASGPCVLLTATRVISPALRRAIAAAWAMRSRTVWRRVAGCSILLRYSVRMRPRQTLPNLWLVSDARTDARDESGLERAMARLPRGAGVVFRHYHLPEREREARFRSLARIARGRGLWLAWAGSAREARALGADACYGPAALLTRGPALGRL